MILYLVLFSAHAAEIWHTSHTFLGLQSEIVNFGYSLPRTLFGTQLKCDIYYSFFLVYGVKKVKFDHSLSHTPSARSRNVTYIADFSGFKNENS